MFLLLRDILVVAEEVRKTFCSLTWQVAEWDSNSVKCTLVGSATLNFSLTYSIVLYIVKHVLNPAFLIKGRSMMGSMLYIYIGTACCFSSSTTW